MTTSSSRFGERLKKAMMHGMLVEVKPTAFVIKRIGKNRFRVAIVDANEEELTVCWEGDLGVKDTLKISDVDRAFDLSITA